MRASAAFGPAHPTRSGSRILDRWRLVRRGPGGARRDGSLPRRSGPARPASPIVVAREAERLQLLVEVALGDAGRARHLADLAAVPLEEPDQVLALEALHQRAA